jgi:hypothetical protein
VVGTVGSNLVTASLHIVSGGRVNVAVLLKGAGGAGVILVLAQTVQPAVVHHDSIREYHVSTRRRGIWGTGVPRGRLPSAQLAP